MDIKNKNQHQNIKFPVRLVKYISSSGIASRRKAFILIQKGDVTVNNTTIREPGFFIEKDDIVCYRNRQIKISDFVYIMLNKPRGYTCTNKDPHAKKKAVDLIDLPGYRLFSIGRLDKDSEGLILFTNDGDFANKISHPSNNIFKTYEVTVTHPLKKSDITEIQKGIIESGEQLKALSVKNIGKNKYQFILSEGKNREIRRLIKYFNSKVTRLKRVAIGNLTVNRLPVGKWKQLTHDEIYPWVLIFGKTTSKS